MNDHQSFQRLTAGTTILAVICYLISALPLLAVMNYSFSAQAFSGSMISTGGCLGITLRRARVIPRWASLLRIVSSPLMKPIAYGTNLGIRQILSFVLVFIGCIPAALLVLSGEYPFHYRMSL